MGESAPVSGNSHGEELRVIEGAAHFLQEDKGPEIAAEINAFIDRA